MHFFTSYLSYKKSEQIGAQIFTLKKNTHSPPIHPGQPSRSNFFYFDAELIQLDFEYKAQYRLISIFSELV